MRLKLSEKLRPGQAYLREGARQEARRCFTEVLDALNETDLDPNFLKAEVSSLRALASDQASLPPGTPQGGVMVAHS